MQITNLVTPPLRLLSPPSQSPNIPKVSISHSTGCSNTQQSCPHAHSFFELFFVVEGEGWYSVGDHKFWAKPNDLFLVAPSEIHDPSGLHDATKWIINFGADALNQTWNDGDLFLMLHSELLLLSFLRTEDVETRHLRVPAKDIPRWLAQLQQLQSELEDKHLGFTEAARALLMLLLVDTARLAAPQLKQGSIQSCSPLKKVFRFIEANYRYQIGLQEVAKEVNLSPAYLTDLVRRETGRTVLNWIVERRIAEARRLLLETDKPVNQIAEKVGYLDTGHFIKLFRRHNGATPQSWRLSQRS